MRHIVNQFRRIWNDDGRSDKVFYHQEYKLKAALAKVKHATDEVIKQSTRLQYLLGSSSFSEPSDGTKH
jgi:hypothetical protein